jgi:UDP-N-acetyl-D-galactosamine dehydrogenase
MGRIFVDLQSSSFVRELQDFGIQVDVHGPLGRCPPSIWDGACTNPTRGYYDGIILAIAHDQFSTMGIITMRGFGKADHVLYDLKNVLDAQESDLRL